MTAREEFNQILNSCYDPRAIYNALFAFASTPSIKKTNDIFEKRSIILDEINSFIDKEVISHD